MYEFRGFHIPERMMGGLTRYIEEGIPPGHFLSAVICNDLCEAVSRADDENIKNLAAYVGYLYNKAPMECWGSEKKFEDWMQKKAMERINAIA